MNPYEVPARAENSLEQRFASLLLKVRETGMTLGTYYRTAVKGYLVLVIAFGIGIAWFAFTGLHPAANMMAGAFIGVLLRDFAVARQQKRIWPTQRKLLNWDKVQRMAAGEPVEE
jgi:hypothetical protein